MGNQAAASSNQASMAPNGGAQVPSMVAESLRAMEAVMNEAMQPQGPQACMQQGKGTGKGEFKGMGKGDMKGKGKGDAFMNSGDDIKGKGKGDGFMSLGDLQGTGKSVSCHVKGSGKGKGKSRPIESYNSFASNSPKAGSFYRDGNQCPDRRSFQSDAMMSRNSFAPMQAGESFAAGLPPSAARAGKTQLPVGVSFVARPSESTTTQRSHEVSTQMPFEKQGSFFMPSTEPSPQGVSTSLQPNLATSNHGNLPSILPSSGSFMDMPSLVPNMNHRSRHGDFHPGLEMIHEYNDRS